MSGKAGTCISGTASPGSSAGRAKRAKSRGRIAPGPRLDQTADEIFGSIARYCDRNQQLTPVGPAPASTAAPRGARRSSLAVRCCQCRSTGGRI